MKTILSLPSEIIEIISNKLTKEDFRKCLCVSKSWYNVFIHKLYKQLDIKNEQQLQQICNNLLKQAPHSLADSVRVINLRCKHIKNNHLAQLSAWCINVECFSLHWSIWNEDQKDIEINNDFSTSMASVIGPLRHLLRLHLDVSFGKNNAIIPDFLPYLFHLTFLSLANSNHITLEYIEYIHQQCPVLQYLCLQGMDVTHLPLFKKKNKDSDNDNNIVQDQFNNMIDIKPATSLISIELEFVNGGYEYYPLWFLYFSKKYPKLITFKMYQYSSFISSETLATYHRLNTQLSQYAIHSLLVNCSQLANVYLQNMYINSDFFKIIGPQLQHLFIHFIDLKIHPHINMNILPNNNNNDNNDQQLQTLSPLTPSLPITGSRYLSTICNYSLFNQRLTSLDIAPPTNDTLHPVTPENFLSSLSHLDQLKHLSLRWKTQSPPFYLDTILQTFPHLISLQLTFMTLLVNPLDFSPPSSSSSPYLLQSLTLKGVSYHNYVFLWINQYIPSLSHLHLKNSCKSYYSTTTPSTTEMDQPMRCHHVVLPNLNLQSFTISERRHQPLPVQLYMLHQSHQTRRNKKDNKNNNTTITLDDYLPRFSNLYQQEKNKKKWIEEEEEDKYAWYFLNIPDSDIEKIWESELVRLNAEQNFEWVILYYNVKKICPWYADFCDAAEEVYKNAKLDKDKVDSIQGIEYMNIVCRSIKSLYINDKLVPFI